VRDRSTDDRRPPYRRRTDPTSPPGVTLSPDSFIFIGDCVAYALATATGHTLLFKSDDFIHTDIRPALPPELGVP